MWEEKFLTRSSTIKMLNASAIILAGGESSRMKVNKAFVTINRQQMIELVIMKLWPLFTDVIVVTNNPEDYAGLGVTILLLMHVQTR